MEHPVRHVGWQKTQRVTGITIDTYFTYLLFTRARKRAGLCNRVCPYIILLASEQSVQDTLRSVQSRIADLYIIGERAKRARHSQVCSIENRGYIYYLESSSR